MIDCYNDRGKNYWRCPWLCPEVITNCPCNRAKWCEAVEDTGDNVNGLLKNSVNTHLPITEQE